MKTFILHIKNGIQTVKPYYELLFNNDFIFFCVFELSCSSGLNFLRFKKIKSIYNRIVQQLLIFILKQK